VQSRIVVLALDNAGTVELAVVNISGGTNLTETNLISTTAEGGAGAADSASTVYSTTARSNLAYRVVGYIESTQGTAGTWATAPSTIQGCGGQALTAMSSLGYGQTWQAPSRALGTTYYNTTGKPIFVGVTRTSTTTDGFGIFINSVQQFVASAATGSSIATMSFIVPPGASYSVNSGVSAVNSWAELF
jgi:hypothetical protein